MKKIKKSTLAVIAVLAALAVGVAVLAALNGRSAGLKKQLLNDAAFLLTANGAEHKITMEEFRGLGLREIRANYKKSGKAPETRTYTGISFAEVLRFKNIELAGVTKVIFSASDNYATALRLDEALDEENCFIVADDDEGPFRMVLARDQFSQRWCSYLINVELK